MAIAFTGHRPPRLGLGYARADQLCLIEFCRLELNAYVDSVGAFICESTKLINEPTIIAGGAQGFDQAVMAAAAGFPMIAAIPFVGHESKWPADAQAYYRDLLAQCETVQYFGKAYSNKLFAVRDRWMVDNADIVIALFDGVDNGGTALTVKYAISKEKPLINWWDKWVKYRDKNLEEFRASYKNPT